MIQIDHLTRRFHDLLAVDDVSLHIEEGEIVGFLGPNGAGKSTTIRILTGFLSATSGRAEVAGHDVAVNSLAVRRQIGYLPEHVPLPLDARVDEYIDFRARLKGVSRKQRRARRDDVLEQVGLSHMRRRIVGQLSRGYRQRVGLADALVSDPPVLILDEPTGGLDPGQRQEVLELVGRLRGTRTVLLSSHVLAEVETLCSRVAIIKQGRLVAVGTKEELEANVGRRGEVAVRSAGPTEELTAALTRRGLAPREERQGERSDGTQVVHLGQELSPAQLLGNLVRDGVPVESFEPLTRSLHEIFLDLTRPDGGDSSAPHGAEASQGEAS